MKTFTKKDLGITGLKPRQIQFLHDYCGFVASIADGEGIGKHRRYSETDVWLLGIMAWLYDKGFPLGYVGREILKIKKRVGQ